MIRVAVGCPANNEDLECMAVLCHSLLKHASEPVELHWIMLSRDPANFWYSDPQAKPRQGWNTKSWATPFSPFRFALPAFFNYEGKVIYCDSDIIFLDDVANLWNQPLTGDAAIISKAGTERYCVSLFDCEKMRGIVPDVQKLKSDPMVYRSTRGKIQKYVQNFQGNWNCVDGESYKSLTDPDIKVLHYSAIPTQPNHRHARTRLAAEGNGKSHWYPGPDRPHPRKELTQLFDQTLAEAIAAGRGPENFRVSPEFGDYGRGG